MSQLIPLRPADRRRHPLRATFIARRRQQHRLFPFGIDWRLVGHLLLGASVAIAGVTIFARVLFVLVARLAHAWGWL